MPLKKWLKPGAWGCRMEGPANESASFRPTIIRRHAHTCLWVAPLRRTIRIRLPGRFKLRPPIVQTFLYPALKADIAGLIVAPALG
jgi:hypothetical protein